jgi:hypothetical protein
MIAIEEVIELLTIPMMVNQKFDAEPLIKHKLNNFQYKILRHFVDMYNEMNELELENKEYKKKYRELKKKKELK